MLKTLPFLGSKVLISDNSNIFFCRSHFVEEPQLKIISFRSIKIDIYIWGWGSHLSLYLYLYSLFLNGQSFQGYHCKSDTAILTSHEITRIVPLSSFYLFSRWVRTLSCLPIIVCPVERHWSLSITLFIIHLITS